MDQRKVSTSKVTWEWIFFNLSERGLFIHVSFIFERISLDDISPKVL